MKLPANFALPPNAKVTTVNMAKIEDAMKQDRPIESIASPLTAIVHVKTHNPLNGRRSWQAEHSASKKQINAVWASLVEYSRYATFFAQGCMVVLTRCSAGQLDGDNLQAALKHIRDGVAQWLFGGEVGRHDDNPKVVWKYEQEKAKRGQHFVRIAFHALSQTTVLVPSTPSVAEPLPASDELSPAPPPRHLLWPP